MFPQEKKWMFVVRTTASAILLPLVLTGCATYHARPLNTTDLAKTLSASAKKELAQEATLLNHPRIAPISLDFSKPLTSKQLAVLAVLISPDLKVFRAKNGVAKAQVFDAGLLPDPQFAFNFAYPLHPMPGIVNAFTAGLNWDVGALFTRQTKLRIAKSKAQQIRYDVAWQEWLLANQTELLATRIYFLRQQLYLAERAMKTARHVLRVTQYNLEKHDATIGEFGLRQATYLDFFDQKITLQRSLQKTVLLLNKILGLPETEKIPVNVNPISIPARLNAANFFQKAQVSRLDLLALQAGYASQEAVFYQAILGQFPHFSLGINRAQDNTDVQSVGTDINFDIPLFNRNRGAIAIAKATREQLYLEYISRLNETRSEIEILVADLELMQSEKNITLLSYQTVLSSLLTNKMRLLALRQNITEQIIALQIATGKYLN
jgi:cobalt-zinc-cadmium efflux system outer membrane protein